MIKRFSIRKISKYTIILLIVFLFYLFPKSEEYSLDKIVNNNIDINLHDIFLMDKNNYLAKTKIEVLSNNKEDLVEEIIEIIKKDGKYIDKIPNGFTPILPVDTKILDKKIIDDKVLINFSKELFEERKEFEEKIIESIIYNITSIEGINKVIIKVENKILKKLPKTGKILNEELTREYGINKIYDITGIKNVSKVVIYYTSKTNSQNEYYVPVTKYINSDDDKIKIIIDELTSKISYESNLMSYLNYNTKLIDYSFNEDKIDLNFNEYLFDNNENKKVLEEVIYSISYSINDTLNVSKVHFFVNNEEIK